MRLGDTKATLFKFNNTHIKDTGTFCYLASMISRDGGAIDAIKQCINKAKQVFSM